MQKSTANTNKLNANKHEPKNECERMHVRINNGVPMRERGKRGGQEDADNTHTRGKPNAPCPPTNY